MYRPSRRMLFIGGLAVVTLGGAAAVAVQSGLFAQPLAPAPVFATDGVALRGYDPVAYFTAGAPTKGSKAHTATWNGASWHFADAANRDRFLADPERYAPQYGGFCAWAVAAKGQLFSTEPSAWAIVDDKLYLNFNSAIQEQWETDIPGFIADGDRRWPEIIGSI